MTLYNFELLFPEDMPMNIQESIEKTIETSRPVLFKEDIRFHEAKLRYIPLIEASAIKGRLLELRNGEIMVKKE